MRSDHYSAGRRSRFDEMEKKMMSIYVVLIPIASNMPEITSRVINEAKKNEVKHIVKLSVLSAEAEPGLIIGRMHRQEENL
jgi:hypothetical protein